MALLSKKTFVFVLWGGFATLFVGALWHRSTLVSSLIALAVTVVMGIWFFQEWQKESRAFHLWDGLVFSLGAGVTLGLNHYTPLDNIASASLIGILAAYRFKKLEVPVYAGAFLGMSSGFFLAPLPLILTLFGGGVLYALSGPFFSGLGGKLGFLAWMVSLTAALILRYPLRGEFTGVSWIGLWFLSTVIIIGMAFMVQRASLSSVLASSLVGLIIAAWMVLFPQMGVYGAAAFGASFVGMSSAQRLPLNGGLFVAATVYTLLFILLLPYFPGLGGKLGAMAFVSTAITYTTLQKFNNKT